MEFFATSIISATAADLQRRLTISELPRWCASVETVLGDATSSGEIYCVWGTFDINCEHLHHGVRFSLPDCPYVLQWTVTTGHDPIPQHTYIHLTTNRTEHDKELIDSINTFMADWKAGLEAHW